MTLVDMQGFGAEIVLDGDLPHARLWFPTLVKALLFKAQLEADDRFTQALQQQRGATSEAAAVR